MSSASTTRFRLPTFGIGAQLIALVLVLGLVSAMAIQPTRELLAQQHRITATARELHRTQRVNAQLDQRIARLRSPDFIEEQARAEIGLVRPGEIAYLVMPKAAAKGDKHHQPRHHRTHKATHTDVGVIRGFLNFLGL